MTKPVAFSEDGARRIIAATKAVEAGSRDMPPIKFRQVADDGGGSTKVGKTTETWPKNTVATIALYDGGTPPEETREDDATLAQCVNKFDDVPADRWVVVCQATNGYWYLVEYERTGCELPITRAYLTTVDGYDQTIPQVLAHEEGSGASCVTLKWINVIDCDPDAT